MAATALIDASIFRVSSLYFEEDHFERAGECSLGAAKNKRKKRLPA